MADFIFCHTYILLNKKYKNNKNNYKNKEKRIKTKIVTEQKL